MRIKQPDQEFKAVHVFYTGEIPHIFMSDTFSPGTKPPSVECFFLFQIRLRKSTNPIKSARFF